MWNKHIESKFSPTKISSAHDQLDTDTKDIKANMKCYSRGLLSEWEHFYNKEISSFTSNCSYSQLLRYIHQNVTQTISKDILKNEPENYMQLATATTTTKIR